MEKIKRIMIVTEDEESSRFFKSMFREKQYQDVSQCFDPREGLMMLEAKRIQLCIVKREMEKEPGPIFIQKIHSSRLLTYLPCLLFSERLTDDSVRLARELGKDVLKVPLVKEHVWPVIEKLIQREESIDQVELELRKAEAAISDKQPSVAIELIKLATEKSGPTVRSLTLAGEAYFQLGEYDKAEKVLDAALAQRQNHCPAMQILAKTYSHSGRHDRAIKILSAMADSSPLNLATLTSLGSICAEANQLELAKSVLERVRGLDPGNKTAAAELGKIAYREGDHAKAEQFLAEVDDAAEFGRFFNNLAVGMVNQGKIDEALCAYESAMRIVKNKDPKNLIYLQYNLGIACKKKGNLQLAFALLSSCCMASPSYDRAHSSLTGVVREMRRQGLEYDKALLQRIEAARASLGPAA
jgi:tetratricopeptide (TPR) repeat protein